MAFFEKIRGKLFGQPTREQQVAKARAERARREEREAGLFGQRLAEAVSQAQRTSEEQSQEQRAKLIALAAQEREARFRAEQARREAQAAKQEAAVREGRESLREQIQAVARETEAQTSGRRYQSRKRYGTGLSPEWEEFLIGWPYSRFSSSNVQTIQYDPTKKQLYVAFIKSRHNWYRWSDIDRSTAYEFFIAASKGKWVWARLRRPGRSFERGMHPPAGLPLEGSAAEFVLGGGGL